MTTTEPWTVLRLLEWTEGFLRENHSDSPRLDAEVLLATARNCQRIDLYTAYSEVADEETRAAFRELVRRRAEGTPVAYLVGYREFYSRRFRVTSDVLIPRPETEFALVELLDRVRAEQTPEPVRIVDVGTGSGILAVNAALELPAATITATDISAAALDVARRNAADHGVVERIRFIQGDLLRELPPDPTLDFVVSNPPYVSDSEYTALDPQVRDHEPRIALVAGARGMDVMEKLIPEAAERLRPHGWLILEISPMIEELVLQSLQEDGRFHSLKTTKDLAQLARVVSAQRR